MKASDLNGYIDCHTHVGVNYTALYKCHYPATYSSTVLSECLSRNNIQYAIVFPSSNTLYYDVRAFWDGKGFIPSKQCDFPFEIENNYMVAEILHFELRHLLPFCMMSLRTKIIDQIKHIKYLMTKTHIYGIKFHPLADNMSIKHIEDFPELLDFIIENNLPLLVHTSNDEFASPQYVMDFANKHTNIRICAAHLARFNKEFYEQLDSCADNLFMDMSPFLGLCERHGQYGNNIEVDFSDPVKLAGYLVNRYPNRILLGTDQPYTYTSKMLKGKCARFTTYEDEMKWFNQLSEKEREWIAHRNPIRFLFG